MSDPMPLDPLSIVTLGIAGAGAIALVVELRVRVGRLEEDKQKLDGRLERLEHGIEQIKGMIRGELE